MKNLIIVVLAAGLVPAATPAFAEDEAPVEESRFLDQSFEWLTTDTWVGLNLGISASADSGLSASDLPATSAVIGTEEGGTPYRFFFGKRFREHFSMELGFADLGDIDVGVVATGVTDNAAYLQTLANNAPVAPSGITVDAVGDWTLGDFGVEGDWASQLSLLARGGLFAWDTEISFREGTNVYRATDSGVDLHLGLGAAWEFNQHWSARLEWETYMAETKMDVFSLGTTYAF